MPYVIENVEGSPLRREGLGHGATFEIDQLLEIRALPAWQKAGDGFGFGSSQSERREL